MVLSKISRTDLPTFFIEAIKTTNYRVPSNSVPKTPSKFWTTRKPSLRQEKKLDLKTIRCRLSHKHKENATGNEDLIFEEEGDVAVIENVEQEVKPLIPLSETVLENSQFEEPIEPQEQVVENPDLDDPQEPVQPRRSDRPRRSTTNLDYVYLQEADFDNGDEADPTSFREAMESQNADKWREAMLNELESKKNN
ncbi:unnamed protein product [Prunus armeniaca]